MEHINLEYLTDGYMREEVLATGEEAVEIASLVEYDKRDVAHIAVMRTLSIGTSTVELMVERVSTSVLACAYQMLIDVVSMLRRLSRD